MTLPRSIAKMFVEFFELTMTSRSTSSFCSSSYPLVYIATSLHTLYLEFTLLSPRSVSPSLSSKVCRSQDTVIRTVRRSFLFESGVHRTVPTVCFEVKSYGLFSSSLEFTVQSQQSVWKKWISPVQANLPTLTTLVTMFNKIGSLGYLQTIQADQTFRALLLLYASFGS